MTEVQKVVKEKKKRVYKRLPIEVGDRVKIIQSEYITMPVGTLSTVESIGYTHLTQTKFFRVTDPNNSIVTGLSFLSKELKLIRKALK